MANILETPLLQNCCRDYKFRVKYNFVNFFCRIHAISYTVFTFYINKPHVSHKLQTGECFKIKQFAKLSTYAAAHHDQHLPTCKLLHDAQLNDRHGYDHPHTT